MAKKQCITFVKVYLTENDSGFLSWNGDIFFSGFPAASGCLGVRLSHNDDGFLNALIFC